MRTILNAMSRGLDTNPEQTNGRAADVLAAIIRLFAGMFGALLLAVFALLEPIVRPVLCATALLTLTAAIFFRFAVGDAAFPFWGMVTLSLACMLLLDLYYRVARLLCSRA